MISPYILLLKNEKIQPELEFKNSGFPERFYKANYNTALEDQRSVIK